MHTFMRHDLGIDTADREAHEAEIIRVGLDPFALDAALERDDVLVQVGDDRDAVAGLAPERAPPERIERAMIAEHEHLGSEAAAVRWLDLALDDDPLAVRVLHP